MVFKKVVILVFLISTLNISGSSNHKNEFQQFKAKTVEKISVMNKKIEKIGNKVTHLSGKAKIKMKNHYDELVAMKNSLEDKLEEAGESTGDNWDIFKKKIEYYAKSLESRADKVLN